MKKTALILSTVLLSVMISTGTVSCDGTGPGDSAGDEIQPGMGRVYGTVLDPQDDTTYEGASIRIYSAVEAGEYRLAEDEPLQQDYEAGELVTEAESGKDGYWQADLKPGKYYIRAFYGDASYSSEILVEIESGEKTELNLELIHGS